MDGGKGKGQGGYPQKGSTARLKQKISGDKVGKWYTPNKQPKDKIRENAKPTSKMRKDAL